MTYQSHVYDLTTAPSIQGDVEWYVRKARDCGGPVLELGTGTGRVTLPIAEAGVAIHALDASDDMLGALRRKLAQRPREIRERVTAVHGDMRSFDLPERFALIISPFRTFLHNLTEQDQLACLASVRKHLRPGGAFAFNVFHPSLEFMAQHAGPLAGRWRWSGTHDAPDGGFVVRSEAMRYDTVRQQVHAILRHEEYTPDGTLARTSTQRLDLAYLYPNDIRRVLQQAGFANVSITAGFAGRDFAHDGDELVVEAS